MFRRGSKGVDGYKIVWIRKQLFFEKLEELNVLNFRKKLCQKKKTYSDRAFSDGVLANWKWGLRGLGLRGTAPAALNLFISDKWNIRWFLSTSKQKNWRVTNFSFQKWFQRKCGKGVQKLKNDVPTEGRFEGRLGGRTTVGDGGCGTWNPLLLAWRLIGCGCWLDGSIGGVSFFFKADGWGNSLGDEVLKKDLNVRLRISKKNQHVCNLGKLKFVFVEEEVKDSLRLSCRSAIFVVAPLFTKNKCQEHKISNIWLLLMTFVEGKFDGRRNKDTD